MAKQCKEQSCEATIEDKFEYCFKHYKQAVPTVSEKKTPAVVAWHDDPVVDQLMKLNNNMKRLADALEGVHKELRDYSDSH
jgi:hypothetical protein